MLVSCVGSAVDEIEIEAQLAPGIGVSVCVSLCDEDEYNREKRLIFLGNWVSTPERKEGSGGGRQVPNPKQIRHMCPFSTCVPPHSTH